MGCCAAGEGSIAGSSAVVLARVRAINQSYITRATTVSISRTIYLASNSAVLSGPTSLVVASTVFDTLQTDYGWNADVTGYNFRDAILGSALTTVGKIALVYSLVDSDGLTSLYRIEHTVKAVV